MSWNLEGFSAFLYVRVCCLLHSSASEEPLFGAFTLQVAQMATTLDMMLWLAAGMKIFLNASYGMGREVWIVV